MLSGPEGAAFNFSVFIVGSAAQGRGRQNPVQGQTASVLGSAGRTVPVATAWLLALPWRCEGGHTQGDQWAWLCSSKTSKIKTGAGWTWPRSDRRDVLG